ncbi:hypothetical protein DL96DRAFT_1676351 [Flagelloscypha sp. PMI_526]|nr:hypothetical protein DL96DRAFT_1676351 [Flagelloscypha sp. PMI_526]
MSTVRSWRTFQLSPNNHELPPTGTYWQGTKLLGRCQLAFLFPDFQSGISIAQFTKLLIKLGTHISTLRIEGEFTDQEWDYERSIRWEDLSPTLCHCLYEHIMPSLKILELPGVACVPVFQILRKNPLLRHIHLGSEDGPFEEHDFRPDTELSKFIKYNEGNIATFHLDGDYSFSSSLEFLSPFPEFTSHVLHISIGHGMFERAKWFNWIAKSLHPALISLETSALPLKKLHLTVTPGDALQRPTENQVMTNELNNLAHNSRLSCSLEFSVSVSKGYDKFQSVFENLREFFPSWDQMGRLKLWVEC